MAKGIDIGTMFLVKGEMDEMLNEPSFSVERNVFLEAASGPDTEDVLKENHWSYAKYQDQFYILGEDALKLKNLLTISSPDKSILLTQVGELRRPMKDGILNTSNEKLSVAMIQKIISNLVGKPSHKDEVLCFCSPGDSVDSNITTVFHKTMLTSFLKSLGYHVECIPEALAIIFSERPVAQDESEPNGEAPFSGISISCGAGMMNICLAWKKMPLINFSIARSGDWIDKEAAKTSGIDVSAMTRFKEKKLDLDNIDYSDMKQASLDIYYQNMIEHAVTNFAVKFKQLSSNIDSPLEIIIAGGTAMVPGFINKFKNVVSSIPDLPFKIKDIKLANNPLYTVSRGCLIKATSVESKNKTEDTSDRKPNKGK